MKMTIYVQDELREMMKEFDQQANWSGVACEAFRSTVYQLRVLKAIQKGDDPMDDVIERLRASKEDAIEADKEKGRVVGSDWAKQTATYAQLRRLGNEFPSGVSTEIDALGLAKVILEEECLSWSDMRDAWTDQIGIDEEEYDADHTDGFFSGFIEGALEVWDEVKDEV